MSIRYPSTERLDLSKATQVVKAAFALKDKAFPKEEDTSPQAHEILVSHILNNKSDRIGVCASRGLAKSRWGGNYIPLILPLLGIGVGPVDKHKFIVIISATFEGATDMVQEIKDLYETLGDSYKQLLKKKIWKADEISFELPNGEYIAIVAMGGEGKIRGIRRRGARPDLLIFDDSEYEELVLNPARMKKWKQWVSRSAIPSMGKVGSVLWIGTPLPNSILNEIQDNVKWSFINLPIHDDFGTPAWISRFPYSWIQKRKAELKEMGEINAWYQEYELKIISEDEQIFKTSMIRHIDYSEVENIDLDIYVTCDLAISSANGADKTAFVVTGVDENNNIYVLEIFARRCPPSEQVDALLSICQRWYDKTKRQVVLGIERGSLKYAFMDTWERRLKELNHYYKIPKVRELDPYGGSNAKHKRIQQLEPLMLRGSVKFIRGIENIGMLEEELLAFPVSKHDDVSDALSYIFQLVSWREPKDIEPVRYDDDGGYTGLCW